MKKYEKYNVEATDENIKKAIMNNTYDRAKSIKGFIEGLDLLDTSAIISLDARWGEGKTFYIRQAEMSLHYLSKRILNQEDIIQMGFKNQIEYLNLSKIEVDILIR